MPVRIPAPKPPAPPPPAPAPKPSITVEQVEAMLRRRDAEWQAKLDAMAALIRAEIPRIPKPPARKPSRIEFEFDNKGNPTGARLIPEN